MIRRLFRLWVWAAWSLAAVLLHGRGEADAQAREWTLAEAGEARCVVVAAGPQAGGPAGELVHYLEKVSGARAAVLEDLPGPGGPERFTVLVGGAEAVEKARRLGVEVDQAGWEALSDEGYLIRCEKAALLLAGKTELSMFYAVDRFLEKHLGVRWFLPGEIGEVVPLAPTVRVGRVSEAGEPAFRLRWVGKGEAEWARRNGMNVGVGCEGEFETRWFVHTFTRLVPPEKYLAVHPEYFALVDGRRGGGRKADRMQLCTSNPEVAREVAQNIVKIKESEPRLRMISVDPMDSQIFCECPGCTVLDEAGAGAQNAVTRRLLLFYNAVAGLVGREYPDLLLKSIAYHKYAAPPLDRTVRVSNNVVIQLCRSLCHNHALSDSSCPYNRAYNGYLQGWREIAASVAMYEYFYKVSWLELPWPIVHSLRKDIPYFSRLGLFGLATQYSRNFGSNGLAYYVAARLLWDPDLDVDALLDDFYAKFYTGAAGPMREYYETLEGAAERSGLHLARQRPYEEIVRLFTPELLQRLDRSVASAERLTPDERVRARIALVRASLEYAKVCSEYLRTLERVWRERPLPWVSDEDTRRAGAAGEPYLGKIRDALSRGEKIQALSGGTGYMDRLLDPAAVVRNWDKPDLGFGEPVKSRQKGDWLARRAKGGTPGSAPLPARISLWLVGHDFDSDRRKSECELWTVGPAGARVDIGGLAPAGQPGDRSERCFVFGGLDASELLGSRGKAVLLLTNPAGGWRDAALFAAYVMPEDPEVSPSPAEGKDSAGREDRGGGRSGQAALASGEAMKRIRTDLDGVRSQALGFIEFEGGGLAIRDGDTVGLEIDLVR